MSSAIVYPMFAMVLLTASVLVIMFLSRVRAVRENALASSYYRVHQGGIEPDYRMAGPIEGFNPGKFARRLHPTMFANYAQRFDREGDDRFGSATDQKARRTLTREFTVDDAMLQDFKAFVKSQLRDQSLFDEAGFSADTEFIRANFPQRHALKQRDGILDPDAIAEAYWQLHLQARSAWTHELDLRPWMETW